MIFGAKNSPAHFNCLMDKALGQLKWSAAIVYMDDILIPGHNFDDMLTKMRLVFEALKKANITLKA